jgi:membrane fusion protein (multidrug efflux system)
MILSMTTPMNLSLNALAVRVLLGALAILVLPACEEHHGEEHEHEEPPKIVVTRPAEKDVEVTQKYVCLINARKHIVVRAQHKEAGYLDEIHVQEGQTVKAGQELFRINPTLYEARYRAELAEVKFAEQEYKNAKQLFEAPDNPIISEQELRLYEAKLARAEANAAKAKAELDFTSIKAPFDGIIDRQLHQQGSLIKEGDELTTLSDNTVMWVYFNVPEAQYLDYKKQQIERTPGSPAKLELTDSRIELVLANGSNVPESRRQDRSRSKPSSTTRRATSRSAPTSPTPTGYCATVRPDDPDPPGLHEDALVIPQRVDVQMLDKVYVFVVGEDNVIRQREIEIEHELDDIFVVGEGLGVDDRIVPRGCQLIHDGADLEEPEYRKPEEALEARQVPRGVTGARSTTPVPPRPHNPERWIH